MTTLPELPGFAFERLLGKGAYGHVYLARETTGLQRPVALKLFAAEAQPAYTKELEVLTRVEELRRQGRHPGIVQAFGSGEHAGRGWIAFEYLESGSLADLVADQGPLGWERALRHVREAAEAVAVLHDAGLFHRDLKPSNLLLGSDARVRVGDFGLARDLDGTLSTAGSPAFAPPEVIGGQVDPAQRARIDVYGLGATLAFLLTGETSRPGRPDAFALARRDVPRALVDVLLAAMAYEPDERPADAAALLTLLQEITNFADSARPHPPGPEGGGEEREMKPVTRTAPPVIREDLDVEVERPRCPYCHESVGPKDRKQACQECMAWHHADCWTEGQACSACGHVDALEQDAAAPRAPAERRRASFVVLGALAASFVVLVGLFLSAQPTLVSTGVREGPEMILDVDDGPGARDLQIADHGETPETASPIRVGTPLPGRIDRPADQDWFAVDLVGGTHYTIKTWNLDTVLGLFDDQGDQLALNDDVSQNDPSSSVDFNPPADGIYFFCVIHADPYGTGDYEVVVSTR